MYQNFLKSYLNAIYPINIRVLDIQDSIMNNRQIL